MKNVPDGFGPGDLMSLMLWVDKLEAVTKDCWSVFYGQNFQFKACSESLSEEILDYADIIEPINFRDWNLLLSQGIEGTVVVAGRPPLEDDLHVPLASL